MLSKKFRLTENRDFLKAKKYGRRIGDFLFLINYLKNDFDYSRFGFIATKKLGKAVKRHRPLRLLRESVRLMIDKIKPGWDVVLVARPGIVGKGFSEVESELKRLLRKAKLLKD